MKCTRVFFNVYMGYGFQGLTEIAKDAKTDLGADSVVCFVNKSTTAFKLMVGGQYITYYRTGGLNKKIPIDALRMLPEMFGGHTMDFDLAVKKSLEKQLGWGFKMSGKRVNQMARAS